MPAETIVLTLSDESGNPLFEAPLPKSKFDGTAAPAVTDDDTKGYIAGSLWGDRTNHKVYLCTANTTGAAVWGEIPGGGGGAPTTADYLVRTADAGLSAERVVTDTGTITWDWATAGQAKANCVGASPTGGAGGDLAGTYPNPTVALASTTFGLTGVISPAAITGNNHNYNPTGFSTAGIVRLSLSANATITGLVSSGAADQRVLILENLDSSFAVTLAHEDTGSSAGNRFTLPAGLNYTLLPGGAIWLAYDRTSSRWRLLSAEYSTFGASGTGHLPGLVPDPGGSAGSNKFLCEDATFKTVNAVAADVVDNAALANMANAKIKARKTAGTGDPEDCTLSEVLDFIGSAAQGDVLYRGASAWARLGAGTSGQALKTQGASANPAWGDVASASDKQTFLMAGSSTWTKPTGTYKMAHVYLHGSGSGGGAGRRGAAGTSRFGGGSGAAGNYTEETFQFADLPSTVTVTVGAGGAGGVAPFVDNSSGGTGGGGNQSSFGSLLIAEGAASGGGGGTSGGGGAAGTTTAVGTSTALGGAGSAATAGNGAIGGGGTTGSRAAAGGGSGGGINTSNVAGAGGTGGKTPGPAATGTTAGSGGAATGVAGGAASGIASTGHIAGGCGGGGGGGNSSGGGGAGGAGERGGGGGGAGATTNGSQGGDGGAGADGWCVVVCV